MIRELGSRGILVQTELAVDVVYKGEPIGHPRMDLIVAGEVVVELKCVAKLARFTKPKRSPTSKPPEFP
jgi:GxxExxY protein